MNATPEPNVREAVPLFAARDVERSLRSCVDALDLESPTDPPGETVYAPKD